MIAANSTGIPVFVTGGIGGVHRGAQSSKFLYCVLYSFFSLLKNYDIEKFYLPLTVTLKFAELYFDSI